MPIQCTVCTYVTDTHNWSHFVGKNEWNCINGPSESNRSCICMLECTYSILNVLSEGKTWRKSVSDLSSYIQSEPPYPDFEILKNMCCTNYAKIFISWTVVVCTVNIYRYKATLRSPLNELTRLIPYHRY